MAECRYCRWRRQDDGRGQSPRVAVLGAGIAGLSVAHELAERGFGVDVFESSDRVGGLAASQFFHSARIFGPAVPGGDRGRGGQGGAGSSGGDTVSPGPLLPGEHGFRAFYSFYRHLTDTLQRIPMVDRGPYDPARAVPRPQSVADNLQPTFKVAIARSDDTFREIQYDRRKPRSSSSTLYSVAMWMLAMGFQSKDMARVATRMLQFLTSCTRRRYETLTDISMMEYLSKDGQGVSEQFKKEFKNTSRFLVAIDPNQGDAMTQTMVMARLLLDPVVQGEGGNANVDRVLNGPTSERWFDPWQRFLAGPDSVSGGDSGSGDSGDALPGQGVRFFFRQDLRRFTFDGKKRRGKGEITGAVLSCRQPGCTSGTSYQLRTVERGPASGRYHYFVSAVPGNVLWDTLKGGDGALLDADRVETEKHTASLPADARAWIKTVGDPPLARLENLVNESSKANYHPWMSGIQFFLSDNITVLPGHIHFPTSPWALTAVCQSQFWGADFYRRYGHGKVRAIISVDICEFEAPGQLIKKRARDCTGEEIAAEVWHQLASGLKAWNVLLPEPNLPLPLPVKGDKKTTTARARGVRAAAGAGGKKPPLYAFGGAPTIPLPYLDHHLDERIVFKNGDRVDGPMDHDATAKKVNYFVPGVSSWSSRPGPLPSALNWDQGYRVRLGRLVVVGHFAQSFTSINTMEAANESARHGVNGLLADVEEKFQTRPGQSAEHTRAHYERCTIWPLDADEPSDLAFLKEMDEHLYQRDPRSKHLFETLKLDQWVAQLFPQSADIDNFVFDDVVRAGRVGTQKLGDSDQWKSLQKRFGVLWEHLVALGRFSSFYQ